MRAAVAHGKDTRGIAAAEEEIGITVLVDVANRSGCRDAGGQREPGITGDVAEAAVAEIAEQHWPGRRPDQQDVDVAPVVVVGRDCRHDWRIKRQARFAGDIGEPAIAVVAEQMHRWSAAGRGDEQIEIAIMIGVEPGRRARSAQSRQTGCGRHIAEPAGSVLFIQSQSGASEEQQIGAAVVVVVAGHNARSRRRGRAEPCARRIGEAAAIVPVDMQAAAAAVDEIEVAVAIEIGQRHRRGRLGIRAGRIPRCDAAGAGERDGRVGKGHVRHAIVHQLRLGAGRRDRLRVAPLLEIVLSDGCSASTLAQLLKMLQNLLSLLTLTAPH